MNHARSLRPRCCDKRKGGCGEQFTPARPMQKACSPRCASSMVEAVKAKRAEKSARDYRRQTRKALESLKTIPDLKKEAQAAFNAWVRGRDKDKPCISCGAPPPDLSGLHAGRDSGHYRSTGSADHLRFEPDNCHAQCVHCNQYLAGNVIKYRIGLVARIGLARVEALEQNNDTQKWTREGLREIRDKYKKMAKEL